MATMIERPLFSIPPEQSKKPKSEGVKTAEQLSALEKEALLEWADILDIARRLGIELDNVLDTREANPAYKHVKEHLLKLKDGTLKILFELDSERDKLRRQGVQIDA